MFLSRSFQISLLSFVSVAFSSALETRSGATEATYKLSKSNQCPSRGGTWQKVLPDVCIPVAGTGNSLLEVKGPWPLCANGTEAKAAFFWADSNNCDPTTNGYQALDDKKGVLGVCSFLVVTGSFAFWCDGAPMITAPPTPPTKEEAKGGVIKYPGEKCDEDSDYKEEFHSPDTCIDLDQGLGLTFSRGATCKNGTKAAIAGFRAKGCDPTDDPLPHAVSEWHPMMVGYCAPTEDVQSMAFWCDGFDGIDLTKARKKTKGNSNLGLILGLSLGLGGGLLAIIGGLVLAYNINYHFRTWVQERFGGGDGYIAL